MPWMNQIKYLGIIMDSHLNFRDHIQSLLRKANGLIVRHYPILAALTPDNLRLTVETLASGRRQRRSQIRLFPSLYDATLELIGIVTSSASQLQGLTREYAFGDVWVQKINYYCRQKSRKDNRTDKYISSM
ncbi:hypothetical protein ANN_08757 [Periplaneta americana]|uniref:Uncharacterized protein n=1 Tax=Periplaneta americana TaxID=6978 RepID=A0ABQ8T3Q3_PERAM|nr:hypothetical protein ANN_08757 [Periplaneta americana]